MSRMSPLVEAPPVPLRTDKDGVMRVGKTRVPLDTMPGVFEISLRVPVSVAVEENPFARPMQSRG